jgi:hypothetical protein
MATTDVQVQVQAELQDVLRTQVPTADVEVGSAVYELVVRPAAVLIADQNEAMDALRDNLSLVQELSKTEPDDATVDRLLSNYNIVRKEGTPALGTLNIYTRSPASLAISNTIVFTCAGVAMVPPKTFVGYTGTRPAEDTDTLVYTLMRQLASDLYVFTIQAQTTQVLTTTLSAGQPCTLSPLVSRVLRAETASSFVSAALPETSVQLLQRAQTGINARVLTGRDNIMSFLQNRSDVNVLDVAVFGMTDELLLRDKTFGPASGGMVDVYVRTAPVPNLVKVVLTGTKVGETWTITLPDTYAGAYGVLAVWYGGNRLDASLTPVLGFLALPGDPFMTEDIHARYSPYQTLSVTFPLPDLLTEVATAEFEVEIFYATGLQTLQDLVTAELNRSYGFDMLIKAAVPAVIEVDLEVRYPQGLDVPDEATFQSAIADAINAKPLASEALQSSEIVYAVKTLLPQGEVQMPVQMFARVWLPDGTTAYTYSPHYIKVAPQDGLGEANCMYVCYPGSVRVKLTEVSP